MTVPQEISRSKYVSLTTYRKDGTPVATPVWHVLDGDELVIVSEADAWKVKRIRRNGDVVVTVCNIRGKIDPGAPKATGTARLLDETGTAAARKLLGQKYVTSRLGNGIAKLLRLRRPPMIGIAIRF
jgi:PPOX class probable F420-dependent enzyme